MKGAELQVVVFTHMECHRHQNFFHIDWLGGRNLRAYLKEGLYKLEMYAMLNGATEVVFTGRREWKPILTRFGYSEPNIEMRKNVRRSRGN